MSRTLPLLRRTATRHQSAKPLGGRRSSVTFAPQDAFTEALESEVPGPVLVPASAAAQPQQGQAQQQHLPNSRAPFRGASSKGQPVFSSLPSKSCSVQSLEALQVQQVVRASKQQPLARVPALRQHL